MRKKHHFAAISSFLLLTASLPLGSTASAQPGPGVVIAPMPGDLHVRVVQEPLPPLRPEVVIARPGPNHVWIKGFWHHNGAAWVWTDGRWVEPPRPHVRWIAARYEKVPGGLRYIPGHWSHEHVIFK